MKLRLEQRPFPHHGLVNYVNGLGRHIWHDPESRRYPLKVDHLGLVNVEHRSNINIMNQFSTGKCTAEAATKALSCDPFWITLPTNLQTTLTSSADTWSSGFYSDEETLDGDGPYPPQDNGSYGLTSAKVAQQRGLINGYEHTFSAEDALKGLQLRPFCWGTLWKSGMDDVNEDTGQVTYTGNVRGGHEICAYKLDVNNERLWCFQSWGAWGYQRSGVFWISFTDFELSLADEGDVTFFNPLDQPAPQPVPASTKITLSAADLAILDGWSTHPHRGENRRAAQAWQRGTR